MCLLKPINAPAYDEVSVKRLYADAMKMPAMKLYFPDEYAKGRQADRKFFFDIFNSLHPEEVAAIIAHANKERFGLEANNVKEEVIDMTEEWANQIHEMNFTSR